MRIGVDIGGTKIIVGVVSEKGEVVAKRRIEVQDKSYESVRKRLLEEILYVSKGQQIKSVGVASAGQIEANSQKILFSPNLGWQDVELKKDLEERLRTKVHVENDVNAATYGEWRFALKAQPKTVIGVYIGTGVGGGIIVEGKLFRGSSNVGAEIGHMTLDPRGPRCNCGGKGCFEAFCGGSYIVKRVKDRLKEGYRGVIYDLLGGEIEKLHTGHVEEAYLLGDTLCEELWKEAAFYLGCALANLLNIFNPEVILLGGGVVYGSRTLLSLARPVMEEYALAASLEAVRLVRASLEEDAAILGACFLSGAED